MQPVKPLTLFLEIYAQQLNLLPLPKEAFYALLPKLNQGLAPEAKPEPDWLPVPGFVFHQKRWFYQFVVHNAYYFTQNHLSLREIVRIMATHPHPLLPRLQQYLTEVGENIRLARLRRRLSAGQVAERAAISRATLTAIERGAPSVSLGSYLQVLLALGLEKSILHLAADDALGRTLQDAGLTVKARAPKRVNPARP